jgi:osmoprotectant transport system ATP-binding protein
VREKLQGSGRDYVLVLDDQNRPRRWVNVAELERDGGSLEEAGNPVVAIVDCEADLFVTLDAMVISQKGSAVVVDEEGAYLGVVDFEKVLEVLQTMRDQDRKEAPA